MQTPTWDSDGWDRKTFAPFELFNALQSEWKDVRLQFHSWAWLKEIHGTDTIDDYYLNGYGVQGLVLAARFTAGLEPFCEGLDCNSEGDTCFLHFTRLEDAVETAALAQAMIGDSAKLREMVRVANEQGFED